MYYFDLNVNQWKINYRADFAFGKRTQTTLKVQYCFHETINSQEFIDPTCLILIPDLVAEVLLLRQKT